MKQQPNLRSK